MTHSKFIALASSYAAKTHRVRIHSDWKFSGISNVPPEILDKFCKIINLLQARLDEGCFCNSNQYLLIYNFQTLYEQPPQQIYYSLDIFVKDITTINEINGTLTNGNILNLVINGKTSEVMNSAKFLICELQEELSENSNIDNETPVSYGKYQEYNNYISCMEDPDPLEKDSTTEPTHSFKRR